MTGSSEKYYLFKRLYDIFIVILLSPLLLIGVFIALAVLISMGRPVLYKQERIGKDMKHFVLIKFRTMKNGNEIGRAYLEKDRITGLGALLRKYHLDEIPQLVNVLRGTMTIVGPRPLIKEHLEGLTGIKKRHKVKPGLVCYAQNKLYKERFLDKQEQVDLDLRYINESSLLIDSRVIVESIRLHLKRLLCK